MSKLAININNILRFVGYVQTLKQFVGGCPLLNRHSYCWSKRLALAQGGGLMAKRYRS